MRKVICMKDMEEALFIIQNLRGSKLLTPKNIINVHYQML